jgi:hypothetical protein
MFNIRGVIRRMDPPKLFFYLLYCDNMIIIIIIIITITIIIIIIIIIKIKIFKNFVLVLSGGYCIRCTDFTKTYNPPQTKFLILPLFNTNTILGN